MNGPAPGSEGAMRCREALVRRQKKGLVSIRPTEWDVIADERLKLAARDGRSSRYIARKLGYSLGSLQRRARRLGIKWPRKPGQHR